VAIAQQPPGLPSFDDDHETPGTPRPYALDERTGSLAVRLGSQVFAPVGSLATGLALDEVQAGGLGFVGSVELGLTRHLSLGAEFGYSLGLAPSDCEACESSQLGGGLGATYHLAQGVALDAWGRFGLGVRVLDVTGAGSKELPIGEELGARTATASLDGTYVGFDVAQLRVGAQFAPVRGFSVGPWLGADVGVVVSQPDPILAGTPVYAQVGAGLSIELAPGSWGDAAPSARTTEAERIPSPALPHVSVSSRSHAHR